MFIIVFLLNILYFINSNKLLTQRTIPRLHIIKKISSFFTDNANSFYYLENIPYNNKCYSKPKYINVAPAGLNGFYSLGICSYIKHNYDISEYSFSGVSAGSWNSLYMVYNKDDHGTFIDKLLDNDYSCIKSLKDLEKAIKFNLLNVYSKEDFDLDRIIITVTEMTKSLKFKSNIYSNFDSLSDTIDCCIASSHLPFIVGKFYHEYNDYFALDGGFGNNPYYNVNNSVLHIHPYIWRDIKEQKEIDVPITHINIDKIRKAYHCGYEDAIKNKEFLDKIFLNI